MQSIKGAFQKLKAKFENLSSPRSDKKTDNMGCKASSPQEKPNTEKGVSVTSPTSAKSPSVSAKDSISVMDHMPRFADRSPLSKKAKYTVLVFVCQAKNMKSRDALSKGDAYIVATIGKLKKKTSVFGNSTNPVWNHTFKFQLDEQPTEVVLTAMDHDRFLKDDFIGKVTLPLAGKWEAKEEPHYEWVELQGKENEGVVGNVQVKVMCITTSDKNPELSNELVHFDYTHIVEVTVVGAKHLRTEDFIGSNDSYVAVNWGSKVFKTKVVSGRHPTWNQKVMFFGDEVAHHDWEVLFSVYDKDPVRDDQIGSAYFPIAHAFEAKGEFVKNWLPLRKPAESDKDVADVTTEVSSGKRGAICVSIRVIPKADVQDEFFKKLIAEFDTDHSNTLTRIELGAMVEALDITMTDEEFDTFWDASDKDKSGTIDAEEAVVFLRCLLCQSADTANRVLLFLTEGIDSLQDQIMLESPGYMGETLRLQDRKTGLLIQENIPIYLKVAMKSLFSSGVARAVSTGSRSIALMTKMSEKQGRKYNDPASVKDIPGFVHLHNLNLDEVSKPLNEFKTFNEFFARELKPTARPIGAPDDPTVLVSPADCRMIVFPDIKDATEIWIKGDKFTVENVFGPNCADLAPRFKDGSLCIARLAPQDYHRWHFPCNGKLGRKVPIPGALFTVNPIAINQNVNVYTMNKRVINELDSNEFGKVILIAVGATMVGSITFLVEPPAEANKGQQHGYFSFGGSTVLLFFEPGTVEFDADLVANSKQKLETLVKCCESIGKKKVAPAAAPNQA
jgi:phosphatidylserine decarboxylase